MTHAELPIRHFRLFPAAGPHGETDQIEALDPARRRSC